VNFKQAQEERQLWRRARELKTQLQRMGKRAMELKLKAAMANPGGSKKELRRVVKEIEGELGGGEQGAMEPAKITPQPPTDSAEERPASIIEQRLRAIRKEPK